MKFVIKFKSLLFVDFSLIKVNLALKINYIRLIITHDSNKSLNENLTNRNQAFLMVSTILWVQGCVYSYTFIAPFLKYLNTCLSSECFWLVFIGYVYKLYLRKRQFLKRRFLLKMPSPDPFPTLTRWFQPKRNSSSIRSAFPELNHVYWQTTYPRMQTF